MIKINLLRALKEAPTDQNESGSSGDPIGKFFAKLFPPKEDDVDLGLDGEEASGNPVEAVIKVVLMIAVIGGLFYHESTNIPRLQADLEEENRKLQELVAYNDKAAASVAEIKKLKDHKALIEKQIESLDGLSKVRLKYIRALDLIQTNMPEKMWLLDLETKENILSASGVSFSEAEITQFLDVMGRSVYFSDVSMLSSEDLVSRDGDNRKFKKFNLNFVLEGNK
jgi:hypothetical protein